MMTDNTDSLAHVNLAEDSLPSQVSVLDMKGNIVKGGLRSNHASILFAMMQEAGQLKMNKNEKESIRRITVTLAASRYLVACDEHYLYISEQEIC